MIRRKRAAGFSLIELLLVVAIMGIISAIAIPAFIGQRRRARMIGDAQSNAQILRMQLETYKADAGVYGGAGAVYGWTSSGAVTGGSVATALNFVPKGTSKMNYTVTVGATQLTYVINVVDPTVTGSPTALNMDQNGVVTSMLQ